MLLVDDDARVRLVTELLLRSIGFDVLATGTGRDAIREFERRATEVKLVVLDVTMPDLNGDQVLEELRRCRPDVPVLLCSGYSEEEMCSPLQRGRHGHVPAEAVPVRRVSGAAARLARALERSLTQQRQRRATSLSGAIGLVDADVEPPQEPRVSGAVGRDAG